ncbi:hypothetical protein GOBAR_DD03885 [Gossypium barbadense]|nr:hypothetical protein GOBAR_DD03885 [Gossypium barbadense]
MANYKKPRFKDAAFKRFLSVVLGTLLLVSLLVVSLGTNATPGSSGLDEGLSESVVNIQSFREKLNLPKENDFSIRLEKQNRLPPRNIDLYPRLAKDHITIVLYVHNRPQYLRVVVNSLSKVVGISETLLIVSHDGYFEEMNKIVEGIKFCRLKQIFAPYSPHVFTDSFPGVSSKDCQEKDEAGKKHCVGNPDQYGNHRSPNIVSLKHHWWWMMNTVWDGLKETRGHDGHILFIEEDHFIYPNAYRNLQLLVSLKPNKSQIAMLQIWHPVMKIHGKAKEFCFFDDYNWDITMWATVYPSFGSPVYTLRGPRTSAVHFGKCGLHQGQGKTNACIDNGSVNIQVDDIDKVANIRPEWDVKVYQNQPGYKAGFKGWGGWGDNRDHRLCLNFAQMYH